MRASGVAFAGVRGPAIDDKSQPGTEARDLDVSTFSISIATLNSQVHQLLMWTLEKRISRSIVFVCNPQANCSELASKQALRRIGTYGPLTYTSVSLRASSTRLSITTPFIFKSILAKHFTTMTDLDNSLPIVLYHYYYSPYAQRVVWYLNLRGIPYSQCVSASRSSYAHTYN